MLDDLDKKLQEKKCARCGKDKNTIGQSIDLTEYNDRLYCDECIKIIDVELKIDGIPMSMATDSDKLTGIYRLLNSINKQQNNQTDHLKTIKTIMIIFSVLFVIGLIIQGCS